MRRTFKGLGEALVTFFTPYATLNKLLQRAQALGSDGRWEEAAALLENYKTAHPNSSQYIQVGLQKLDDAASAVIDDLSRSRNYEGISSLLASAPNFFRSSSALAVAERVLTDAGILQASPAVRV